MNKTEKTVKIAMTRGQLERMAKLLGPEPPNEVTYPVYDAMMNALEDMASLEGIKEKQKALSEEIVKRSEKLVALAEQEATINRRLG